MVKVDIEYCGFCNFEKQCHEISEVIKSRSPDASVNCHKGRQGAFEVKIDDELVYSKIQRVAFPDYSSVADNVQRAAEGKTLEKIQEQKINDCCLS
ncbi:migration and invasion enhancer 1 [Condylostylus longicornis]|uniref:migration and invasion enhancer 1 n=1 Tax=Condylostylus longicornis TaxID=2530218 RepID=UPI00244DDACA|nr:migration and invasion enhancer 1 [Condylostylus longicornis]